jgi:hypothetical protein
VEDVMIVRAVEDAMIVRAVLDGHRDRPFDFFNDAQDTISWLRGLKTPDADARASELEAAYDEYVRSRNRAAYQDCGQRKGK